MGRGNSPMRILLITTGLLMGGAEMQVAALAGEYVRQGHTVAILNLLGLTDIAVNPAVHIESLHLRPSTKLLRWWQGVRQARRFVRQWQPDVVHSHMVKANLFSRGLRLICPMHRLICTAHSLHEGGALLMRLYRITDGLCDLTTHVSPEAAALFVQNGAVPAHKITHMPNGIDTERFDLAAAVTPDLIGGPCLLGHSPPNSHGYPVEPGTTNDVGYPNEPGMTDRTTRSFVWLHVGRLAPEKSQHLLLHALAQVVQAQPHTRLLIAGSGPCEAALVALAHTLGLQDHVTFLGRRTDVPQLMHAADAFVLSSHIEGSPLVLAEAMACGLPCVSTDVPGVSALLTPHDRVVPIGNAQALARAMLDTQTEPSPPDLRQERRAHILAHFSLVAVAAQWVSLYGGTP
jgi:glycosyltransferase involved in cell wall biosynthesis